MALEVRGCPPGRLHHGLVLKAGMVLATVLASAEALADDPAIDQTEYLITEAPVIPGERADWQPYQIGQTLGFVVGYVCMRLGFAAPGAMPDNPWLLIRPVHLDHITIYRDAATPTTH